MKELCSFVSIILIAILVVLFFLVPKGANDAVIWSCLLIFYFIFFKSFQKAEIISKGVYSFFKIDILFYLFYYLLLYFPYQTYVIGINNIKINAWLGVTFWEYTNVSIIASTIGLIAFSYGFQFKIKNIIKENKKFSNRQLNKIFFIILGITSFLFIWFINTSITRLLTGSYSGSKLNDRTEDGIYTLLGILFTFLGGFVIFFLKIDKKLNILSIITLIITCLYSAILLISGDRNTFFMVGTSFIGGYFTYIKSISRGTIILMAIWALFIYQVIEISRNLEKRGFNAIIDTISGNVNTSSPSQIGINIDKSSFSITTVASRAGFYFVPEKNDFFYGKFKLIGIAGVVPYLRGLFIQPKDPTQSSAHYLSYSIGAKWGVGTTVIVDIYLDFGIGGIIVLMFFLGWTGSYLKQKSIINPNSAESTILYLVTLATFVEIPRYSFDLIVKNIGWPMFIFFVCRKIMLKRN